MTRYLVGAILLLLIPIAWLYQANTSLKRDITGLEQTNIKLEQEVKNKVEEITKLDEVKTSQETGIKELQVKNKEAKDKNISLLEQVDKRMEVAKSVQEKPDQQNNESNSPEYIGIDYSDLLLKAYNED